MGLRVHSVRETALLQRLPVCDLGVALPQATAHASTPGKNITNRNNRSQPMLNSYKATSNLRLVATRDLE